MASSDEQKVNDSGQPREQLIGTAVKFLQNAKVRDSPFPQRKKFLKQKGLTDEEIQLAIERSGTAGDEALHPADTGQNQSQLVVASRQPVPAVQTVPVSKWSKFRDFTSTAILVGGVSYAVYMIFKHYLAPHLFKPSRQERQVEKLTQSVTELQQTVTSVLQSLQETQKTLAEQQETLKQAVVDTAAGRGSKEMLNMQNTQFVTEIKEEIKSLKGLMLNRRQFPAAPSTTPVLPAWQLQNSQSESNLAGQSETSTMVTGTSKSAVAHSEESALANGETQTSQSEKEPGNARTENAMPPKGESERTVGGTPIQSVTVETVEQSGDKAMQQEEELTEKKQLSGSFFEGLQTTVNTQGAQPLSVNGVLE